MPRMPQEFNRQEFNRQRDENRDDLLMPFYLGNQQHEQLNAGTLPDGNFDNVGLSQPLPDNMLRDEAFPNNNNLRFDQPQFPMSAGGWSQGQHDPFASTNNQGFIIPEIGNMMERQGAPLAMWNTLFDDNLWSGPLPPQQAMDGYTLGNPHLPLEDLWSVPPSTDLLPFPTEPLQGPNNLFASTNEHVSMMESQGTPLEMWNMPFDGSNFLSPQQPAETSYDQSAHTSLVRSESQLHDFMDVIIEITGTGTHLKTYDVDHGTNFSSDFSVLKLNKEEQNICYVYLDTKRLDPKEKLRIQGKLSRSYTEKISEISPSDLRAARDNAALHGFMDAIIATTGTGITLKAYDAEHGTALSSDFTVLKLNKEERSTCYAYLNTKGFDPEEKRRIKGKINDSYTAKISDISPSDVRDARDNVALHGFMEAIIAAADTGITLKAYDAEHGTTFFSDFIELKLNKEEQNTCYAYLDTKGFYSEKKRRIQKKLNDSYTAKISKISYSDIRDARSEYQLHDFMEAIIATTGTGTRLKAYDAEHGTTFFSNFIELKLNQFEQTTCYAYLNTKGLDPKEKQKIQIRLNKSYIKK